MLWQQKGKGGDKLSDKSGKMVVTFVTALLWVGHKVKGTLLSWLPELWLGKM